jgi:hypothetical protein
MNPQSNPHPIPPADDQRVPGAHAPASGGQAESPNLQARKPDALPGSSSSAGVSMVVAAAAPTSPTSAHPAADSRSDGAPPAAENPSRLDLNAPEASKLYPDIKALFSECTRLPDHVCWLLAFWTVFTWFLSAFPVFPCLVVFGPANDGIRVLKILSELCWRPVQLASWRRADLGALVDYRTTLISAPKVDARTVVLLGNLTNRNFTLVDKGELVRCSGARAIYTGALPAEIWNSLSIDVTAPLINMPLPVVRRGSRGASLRQQLEQYQKKHLDQVALGPFDVIDGLSSESAVIAGILASCAVGAPDLQKRIAGLLRHEGEEKIAARANSEEAAILAALLSLLHEGKDRVLASEISVRAGSLLKARGDSRTFSPAKVGRRLNRKLQIATRRLGEDGNGIQLDGETIIRIHQTAAIYLEGSLPDKTNLHCPLCLQYQLVRKDV